MNQSAPLKQCFKCGNHLPHSEFYRHAAMADGLLGKCRECAKRDGRENRKRNHTHYARYERDRAMRPDRVEARKEYARSGRGKEVTTSIKRRWVEGNPTKRAANVALGNAVRDGRVVKPECCSICGETGRLHGHHRDYSKPLDVMWLCPSCHKEWHKENGEGLNSEHEVN